MTIDKKNRLVIHSFIYYFFLILRKSIDACPNKFFNLTTCSIVDVCRLVPKLCFVNLFCRLEHICIYVKYEMMTIQ